MIDFGLSDEYLQGFNARLHDAPLDENQSDDWKMGWVNATQSLKSSVFVLLDKSKYNGDKMVLLNMEMPSKCSECLIEKQDADSYTFADGWDIHYYCPFVAGRNKFYSVSNQTDSVRNSKRHNDCPLSEANGGK